MAAAPHLHLSPVKFLFKIFRKWTEAGTRLCLNFKTGDSQQDVSKTRVKGATALRLRFIQPHLNLWLNVKRETLWWKMSLIDRDWCESVCSLGNICFWEDAWRHRLSQTNITNADYSFKGLYRFFFMFYPINCVLFTLILIVFQITFTIRCQHLGTFI